MPVADRSSRGRRRVSPSGHHGGVETGEASRSAVLVCQGRAVGHGRMAVGRFEDPSAWPLLRIDERVRVEQARGDGPARVLGDRVECAMLQAFAEVMVTRTVAIDDAVRERHNSQLVILGAGLDGRAWRMPELAGVEVFEVDHPASQRDKRARAGALGHAVARSLRFVPVDFTRDNLGEALDGVRHNPAVPTTWVWEGVVPYLTAAEVDSTVAVVAAHSAPRSRLVVTYQAPGLTAALGNVLMPVVMLLARRTDPLSDEPRRSAFTPSDMAAGLARHRLGVAQDVDLLTVAAGLGMAVRHPRSLRLGRLAVADL
jgi:methyltransferase (TIGR00027 family)